MLIKSLGNNAYAGPLSPGAEALRAVVSRHPQDSEHLVLIAPAELTLLRTVAVTESERRFVDRTIPYALEEELADKVESMHFVLAPRKQQQVAVAAVAMQVMNAWVEAFEAEGLSVSAILPELCLLPWQEGQWTLLLDGGRCLLRTAESKGMVFAPQNAALIWSLLLKEDGQLPESLRVYGDEAGWKEARKAVPGELSDKALFQAASYWDCVGQQYCPSGLSLLQGAFAPELPWRLWWKQWRPAAAVLLAAMVMELSLTAFELSSLQRDTQQLEDGMRSLYLSVEPGATVVDPLLQLQRKLGAAGGGQSSGFLVLLDRVAPVIAEMGGVTVENLSYQSQQREIQITLVSKEFSQIETIVRQLQNKGLQAELTGSSSTGGGHRSRLKVWRS